MAKSEEHVDPEKRGKSRRRFLATSAAGAGLLASAAAAKHLLSGGRTPDVQLAASGVVPSGDEWAEFARQYDVLETPINLIAGPNNPSPTPVLRKLIESYTHLNPSPLARGRGSAVREEKEEVRERVARICSAAPEEIGLTRGTTEGMNNIIAGVRLSAGDEILTTKHGEEVRTPSVPEEPLGEPA